MLIETGNVRALAGRPWAGIELSSGFRIQEAVLLIVRWAAARDRPFQLFFPVRSRDLAGIQLLSPYLWARAANLRELAGIDRLQIRINHIQLVRGPDGAIIPVEGRFVEGLIREAEKAAEAWSRGIERGSFVRVLMGRERMLCGVVSRRVNGTAEVTIPLRTRRVRLTVPVRALLNLDRVPKGKREYFYAG